MPSPLLIGPTIVGMVMLATAAAKADRPYLFAAHLDELRLVPQRSVKVTTVMVVLLETGLGAALLVHAWIRSTCLLAIVLLAMFGALSAWGVRTGRTADCGCYGGLHVALPLALFLDGLYLALLLPATLSGALAAMSTPGWKVRVVVGAVLGVPVYACLSYLYLVRTGARWLDRGPLRPGRRFDESILPAQWAPRIRSRGILVFLSSRCRQCKSWLPILNAIQQRDDFPSVVALMGEDAARVRAFVGEHEPRFPVIAVTPKQYFGFVTRTPMAVVVEEGIVVQRWTWFLPRELVTSLAAPVAPDGSRATEPVSRV